MTIERTTHPYIIRDTNIYNGEPIIEGTRTGVRHVILLFQSGKDPEEIASIHRLTLAQVYDALSFYYDNDAEIEHYYPQRAIKKQTHIFPKYVIIYPTFFFELTLYYV